MYLKKIIGKIRKEDVVFVILCVLTALTVACYRSITGDFNAINGDFQNYNIFRRLIDGQVQYRDFTNYLGNGMVFVCFPLVFLFRSFGASVFITYFMTCVLYTLMIFVAVYSLCNDRKKGYIIANITAMAAFVVLHSGRYGKLYFVTNHFFYLEEMVGSMRTVRTFLPFLLVGIFYIIKKITKSGKMAERLFMTTQLSAAAGFVLGMFTVWSNDYGYASVICFFILMCILHIFAKSRDLKKSVFHFFAVGISTAAGMFFSILLITHGHLRDYFAINKGILDYQWWYYEADHYKFLTIFDIFADRTYRVLTVIFFLHAVGFLVCLIRRGVNDDLICMLFLHSVCYGASLIYAVGTGAHNYWPVEFITDILVIGGIIRGVKYAWRRYVSKKPEYRSFKIVHRQAFQFQKFLFSAYLFAAGILGVFAVGIVQRDIDYPSREWIKGLGAYSVAGRGLNECAAEIADGTVFSTYASAIEIINGVFQPSGIDYIIHVLGDEQREKYIELFKKNDYTYAVTPKNEYTYWEYWNTRVNWYFYKELFQRYQPYRENYYACIWKKSETDHTVDTAVNIRKNYVDASTCRIEVELPQYVDGAYVDLYIAYHTAWNENRFRCGGLRKLLCVEDGGEQYTADNFNSCYYLRGESEGCYLPVYVRDGKGYVTLNSYPNSCTNLEGVEVRVETVIPEPEYPLHLTNYRDILPRVATDSVDATGTLLKFDNTEFTVTALRNVAALTANGETGIVTEMWKDGCYIYVRLEAPITRENFVYPNRIEAISENDKKWLQTE